MKTVNIKGKEYVEVNERLIHFRANYPNHALLTEIVRIDAEWVVIKASIFDENNREVANGVAYEKSDSSFINKTSYVENCETSAWGRCLGNFGIGISGAVASAEEVQNAIANQNKFITEEQADEIDQLMVAAELTTLPAINKFLKWAKVEAVENILASDFNRIKTGLNDKIKSLVKP